MLTAVLQYKKFGQKTKINRLLTICVWCPKTGVLQASKDALRLTEVGQLYENTACLARLR
jgi:hypothetical protein